MSKTLFYLDVIFFMYFFALLLKLFINFTDGIIDISLLSFLFILYVVHYKKFFISLKYIFRENFLIIFVILTIYYFVLSFSSTNTFFLIFIEYISVFKWFFYFLFGYIFAYIFNANKLNFFPNYQSLLFVSIIVLFFSILQYNWKGLSDNVGSLFNFYSNRIGSIFNSASIFSLFAMVIFFYSINLFDTKKKISILLFLISTLFMFMSGSRKVVLCVLLVISFIKFYGKFKNIFNMIKVIVLVLVVLLLLNSSLFSNIKREYDRVQQPRIFALIMSCTVAYDYFPIGPGPGTLFSGVSIINYSPLYYKYGINKKWGFGPNDGNVRFNNDTYIAQIIGELGFIGVFLFLGVYISLIRKFKYDNTFRLNYYYILLIALILSVTTPTLQRTMFALFLFFPAGIRYFKIKHRGGAFEKK